MPSDQLQRAAEKLAAKRAAVLRPRSHKRRLVLPVLVAVLVVGVATALLARMLPREDTKPAAGAMFGYAPESGEVAYSLADFDTRTARFYQHKADAGVIVRYFIHRASDGTVRAALDACADCWREARGHRQEGDEVVCAHCDKRFPIAGLAEGADPCVPLSLPVTVRGDQIYVPIPNLVAAAKYFKQPYGRL